MARGSGQMYERVGFRDGAIQPVHVPPPFQTDFVFGARWRLRQRGKSRRSEVVEGKAARKIRNQDEDSLGQ